MTDLINKLKRESADVTRRINKLDTFINTNAIYKTLPFYERMTMKSQLRHMLKYHDCIEKRIVMIVARNTKKDA